MLAGLVLPGSFEGELSHASHSFWWLLGSPKCFLACSCPTWISAFTWSSSHLVSLSQISVSFLLGGHQTLHEESIPYPGLFLFTHSVMSNSLRPCGQASLSITNSWSLLKLMSKSRWCYPTISSSVIPFFLLPLIFPSIRVFSNESALHIGWPNCWIFSISPSNEYLGLISFSIDWFDLLAVQGTVKGLLQHHSSKALTLATKLKDACCLEEKL